MTHVKTFTEDFRTRELEKARQSLFYFATAVLGFDRLREPHHDLCAFLQRPWRRAVVAVYRGGFKSTLTTQSYPMWRALFIPDFSTKLIENSRENATRNHLIPLIDLFVSSPRAPYLQWLFRHRIPANFAGWNSDQLALIKENPLSMPTMSAWGIDSRFEGWHGPLVVLDDPEGADADKSDVPNEDSYRAYQRAIPLLEPPAHGQILVVATSHGDNPLIWRLRELNNWQGEDDNKKSPVKFFWRPLIKSTGEVWEPKRFPPGLVAELALEPMFDQQYKLLKRRKVDVVFNPEAIRDGSWTWVDPGKVIAYKSFEFDIDELNKEGYAERKTVPARVNVDELRYFIHCDPTHRLDEQMRSKKSRPSHNALVVTAVAPDGHAFVMGQWGQSDDLGDMTDEYIRLMRKHSAYKGTFESTGAQIWFLKFLQEKGRMFRQAQTIAYMKGDAKKTDFMVDIYSRTVEANKTNETKEWIFRERLAPWINHQILHLNIVENSPIIDQLEEVSNEAKPIDFVDALSQGPEIWTVPVQDEFRQARTRLRREYTRTFAERRLNIPSSPYRRGVA